jgi:hypothetical protein
MKGEKYYITGRQEMLGILVVSYWKYFRKTAGAGHREIGATIIM